MRRGQKAPLSDVVNTAAGLESADAVFRHFTLLLSLTPSLPRVAHLSLFSLFLSLSASVSLPPSPSHHDCLPLFSLFLLCWGVSRLLPLITPTH